MKAGILFDKAVKILFISQKKQSLKREVKYVLFNGCFKLYTHIF